MAWSKEVLRRIEPVKEVDPEFAEILRQVASGKIGKEEAWSQWLKIEEQRKNETQ
jgi:hypothetical protein